MLAILFMNVFAPFLDHLVVQENVKRRQSDWRRPGVNMQEFTNKYVIGFAVAICVGCSLLIAGTALSLKEVQERNAEVDMKLNVLRAAGLVESGKSLSQEDVLTSFTEQITAKVVDISTGEILEGEEVASLSTAALTADIYKLKAEPNKRPIYLVGPENDRTTIIPRCWKGFVGNDLRLPRLGS